MAGRLRPGLRRGGLAAALAVGPADSARAPSRGAEPEGTPSSLSSPSSESTPLIAATSGAVPAAAPANHSKLACGLIADAALGAAMCAAVFAPGTFEGPAASGPGSTTTMTAREVRFHLFWGHMLAPLFALFLWGSSAHGGAGLCARLMAQPALTGLGEYAFEAYLIHAPLLRIFRPHASEQVGFAWFFVTWLVSALFARFVEVPATNWFRALTAPLLAVAAPAKPAAAEV